MKIASFVAGMALCFGLASTQAQFGGGMGGPGMSRDFEKTLAKLFGENKAFSAAVEIQAEGTADTTMSVPGKLSFDDGKSRMELDLASIKSAKMPAEVLAQMKAMGMGSMITISRPDKKANYMVYPGMQAYLENAVPETKANAADAKLETTEVGKETVDGHACIKNKTVVTGDDNKQHEVMVWNATDLKKFPVKMQMKEKDTTITVLYKDVKLTAPGEKEFDLPADYKKYDNMQAMMQEVMMKQLGGAGGVPGGAPTQSK